MCSELYPENYQHLHQAARVRAQELRRQAISDFWQQAGQLALRVLRRLAALHPTRKA